MVPNAPLGWAAPPPVGEVQAQQGKCLFLAPLLAALAPCPHEARGSGRPGPRQVVTDPRQGPGKGLLAAGGGGSLRPRSRQMPAVRQRVSVTGSMGLGTEVSTNETTKPWTVSRVQ